MLCSVLFFFATVFFDRGRRADAQSGHGRSPSAHLSGHTNSVWDECVFVCVRALWGAYNHADNSELCFEYCAWVLMCAVGWREKCRAQRVWVGTLFSTERSPLFSTARLPHHPSYRATLCGLNGLAWHGSTTLPHHHPPLPAGPGLFFTASSSFSFCPSSSPPETLKLLSFLPCFLLIIVVVFFIVCHLFLRVMPPLCPHLFLHICRLYGYKDATVLANSSLFFPHHYIPFIVDQSVCLAVNYTSHHPNDLTWICSAPPCVHQRTCVLMKATVWTVACVRVYMWGVVRKCIRVCMMPVSVISKCWTKRPTKSQAGKFPSLQTRI